MCVLDAVCFSPLSSRVCTNEHRETEMSVLDVLSIVQQLALVARERVALIAEAKSKVGDLKNEIEVVERTLETVRSVQIEPIQKVNQSVHISRARGRGRACGSWLQHGPVLCSLLVA